MALRDTLLRAAEADLYRQHLSAEILEEFRRNLVRRYQVSGDLKAQRAINTMRRAFPGAEVTGYHPLIASMTNDPKDRHVVAAAVSVGARVIVTSNLRHFRKRDLAPFNVEARSPDDFLTQLYHLAPADMTRILVEQAAKLKNPPMTPVEVLSELAKPAPTFAGLVRPNLPA